MGDVIHGGKVWAAAKAFGKNVNEVLDFSANINAIGPSEKVLELFDDKEKMKQLISHYPEENYDALSQVIAQKYDVKRETVIVGNGATELLSLVLKQQSKVLIPTPTYGEYEDICVKHNIEHVIINFDDVMQGIEKIDLLIEKEKPSAIVLPLPNNPTSQLIPLESLMSWFKNHKDITWIVDASFLQFSKNYEAYWNAVKRHRVTVVMSLTKYYALPGLRLGWMWQVEAEESKRLLDPWRVNALAAEAGIRSMEDKFFDYQSVQLITEERNFACDEWSKRLKLPVPPEDVEANYLLVEWPNAEIKEKISRALYKQGMLLRDGDSFGLPTMTRIAIKDRDANVALLVAYDKLMEKEAAS